MAQLGRLSLDDSPIFAAITLVKSWPSFQTGPRSLSSLSMFSYDGTFLYRNLGNSTNVVYA
jgi:hypothetical protein